MKKSQKILYVVATAFCVVGSVLSLLFIQNMTMPGVKSELALVASLPIAAAANCNPLFTRNLKQGDTHADVKDIQKILNKDVATRISSTGIGSPGQETTYFGGLTKAAVIRFQNKYAAEVLAPSGLRIGTGFVGAATRAKLNTLCRTTVAQQPQLQPQPTILQQPQAQPIVRTTPLPPAVPGSFYISTFSGPGGTISPSGDTLVPKNSSKTLIITPNSGSSILSVTVDGISVGTSSSYTFNSVTANHTITASFQAANVRPSPSPVSPTFVYVKNFGATGDGVTYDNAAIQAAINSTPAGSTVVLEAGKKYRLRVGLIVEKSINFDGQGATLDLYTNAYPDNLHLLYKSKLSTTEKYSWTNPTQIPVGQNTFPIGNANINVGDYVFLSLGQDPNDVNEDAWTTIAKVISKSGSTVTVDASTQYPVQLFPNDPARRATFSHSITKVDSFIQNVTIRNINFSHDSIVIPNAELWLDMVQNTLVENLTGTFAIGTQLSDSKNITIRNVTGTVVSPHPAGGRVLSIWGSDNISAYNYNITSAVDQPIFFLESYARNITVKDVNVNWQLQQPGTVVFFSAGDSYNTLFENVAIQNTYKVALIDSGGQSAKYQFKHVTFSGPVSYVYYAFVDDLTVGTRRYVNPVTLHKEYDIPANKVDFRLPLLSGAIKKVSYSITNRQGVQQIGIGNDVWAHNLLDDQMWIYGVLGPDYYPLNWPDKPDKTVNFFTDNTVVPGSKLILDIEYFP